MTCCPVDLFTAARLRAGCHKDEALCGIRTSYVSGEATGAATASADRARDRPAGTVAPLNPAWKKPVRSCPAVFAAKPVERLLADLPAQPVQGERTLVVHAYPWLLARAVELLPDAGITLLDVDLFAVADVEGRRRS
jgi:hypothetical protein